MKELFESFEEYSVNQALIEEEDMSPTKQKYNDLVKFALVKFDAKSPADLGEEDKKKMFNWLKDNWSKEKGDYKDSKVADDIAAAKKDGKLK